MNIQKTLKRLGIGAALGLVLLGPITLKAQDLPPGPYQNHCKHCVIRGDKLECMCLSGRGRYQPASLPNVSECKWVKNYNTILLCRKSEGKFLGIF